MFYYISTLFSIDLVDSQLGGIDSFLELSLLLSFFDLIFYSCELVELSYSILLNYIFVFLVFLLKKPQSIMSLSFTLSPYVFYLFVGPF